MVVHHHVHVFAEGSGIFDRIKSGAQKMVGKAKQAIGKFDMNKAKDLAMKAASSTVGQKIQNTGKNILDKVKGKAESLASRAKSKAVKHLGKLADSASSAVDKGLSTIEKRASKFLPDDDGDDNDDDGFHQEQGTGMRRRKAQRVPVKDLTRKQMEYMMYKKRGRGL